MHFVLSGRVYCALATGGVRRMRPAAGCAATYASNATALTVSSEFDAAAIVQRKHRNTSISGLRRRAAAADELRRGRGGLSFFAAITLRCVWSSREHSSGKHWHFPVELPGNAPVISECTRSRHHSPHRPAFRAAENLGLCLDSGCYAGGDNSPSSDDNA